MAFQKVGDITVPLFQGGAIFSNSASLRSSSKYRHRLFTAHGLNGNWHQFDAILNYDFPFHCDVYNLQNHNQRNYDAAEHAAIVKMCNETHYDTTFYIGFSQGGMDGTSLVVKSTCGQRNPENGNIEFKIGKFQWTGAAIVAGKTGVRPLADEMYKPLSSVKWKHFHHENDPTMGESSIRFANELKELGADSELKVYPGSSHSTLKPTLDLNNSEGFYEWYVRKIQEWERSQVEEPIKHRIQFEREIQSLGIEGTVYMTHMGCDTHAIVSIPDTTNGRYDMGIVNYIHDTDFDYPVSVWAPENSPGANFSMHKSNALNAAMSCSYKSITLVGSGKGVMEASNVLKPRIGLLLIVASKTAITDYNSFKGITVRIWRGTKDYESGGSMVTFYKGLKDAGVDVKMFESDTDHDQTVALAFNPSNETGVFAEHRKYVLTLGN